MLASLKKATCLHSLVDEGGELVIVDHLEGRGNSGKTTTSSRSNPLQRIFIFSHWDSVLLEEFYVRAQEGLSGFLLSAQVEERLPFLVDQWNLRLLEDEVRKKTLRNTSQNLKELELLNSDLESMVKERTKYLRQSKEEEDRRSQKFRDLIQFILELSRAVSEDDIVRIFRRSFKSFLGVHSVFLSTGQKVALFEGSELRIRSWSKLQGSASSGEEFSFESLRQGVLPSMRQDWTQFLAEIFQRPVLPVLVAGNGVFIFGLELDLEKAQVEDVRGSLEQKANPLVAALSRVRDEISIESSAQLWEKTFDSLADPIAIVSSDYSLIRANENFRRHGGKRCYEILFNRESPCESCRLGGSGAVHNETLSFQMGSYPLQLQSGQRHFVNVYRNQKLDQELEANWVLTQKMSALGRLAGNLSHELNNPLSGLRALAQYWIRQTNRDSLKSDFQEIESATERSQNLIRKLVRFSQSSSTEDIVFFWDQMVQDTLPLLKSSFRRSRLELNLQAQGARIKADEVLFQQVIYNLIKNAAQAQEGSGANEAWIRLESRVSGQRIEFHVMDRGPGISLDIQKKLFQPFVTTKEPGLGTGLGLFFVQRVVQRYGGSVRFENRLEGGGEFILDMPLVGDLG
ncbi:MAG: HAMP domain-containing sensor histidine kinase [Bdellovibrio sp.]